MTPTAADNPANAGPQRGALAPAPTCAGKQVQPPCSRGQLVPQPAEGLQHVEHGGAHLLHHGPRALTWWGQQPPARHRNRICPLPSKEQGFLAPSNPVSCAADCVGAPLQQPGALEIISQEIRRASENPQARTHVLPETNYELMQCCAVPMATKGAGRGEDNHLMLSAMKSVVNTATDPLPPHVGFCRALCSR